MRRLRHAEDAQEWSEVTTLFRLVVFAYKEHNIFIPVCHTADALGILHVHACVSCRG